MFCKQLIVQPNQWLHWAVSSCSTISGVLDNTDIVSTLFCQITELYNLDLFICAYIYMFCFEEKERICVDVHLCRSAKIKKEFSLKYKIFSTDYETVMMESDLVPIRTGGLVLVTGTFEDQEPVQFEERHLIFLQQLGKVVHFKCSLSPSSHFNFKRKSMVSRCPHILCIRRPTDHICLF